MKLCGNLSRERVSRKDTVIDCRAAAFYAESPDRSGRAIHGIRSPLTCRIGADYTTRASYQAEYRKRNREAINARKRAWRKQNKLNATP